MTSAEPNRAAMGRRRVTLSRAEIAQAAVALARAEGVEAVTMRRLAGELDTSPMSLYRHVQDRRELMLAMLDVVAGGIVLLPPAGDPRAEVTAVMTAIHDALRADPWAVGLIVGDKLASPLILPAVDRIYSALGRAGLSARDISVAYALMWHYTAGELADSHHPAVDYSRRMVRGADRSLYPGLAAVLEAIPEGPPSDHFAENLQRILDGLRLSG